MGLCRLFHAATRPCLSNLIGAVTRNEMHQMPSGIGAAACWLVTRIQRHQNSKDLMMFALFSFHCGEKNVPYLSSEVNATMLLAALCPLSSILATAELFAFGGSRPRR